MKKLYPSAQCSVAISGNIALIGSPEEDSAHFFVRSGAVWTKQQEIKPTDIISGDKFGTSVSIDGDYAIIGATKDEQFSEFIEPIHGESNYGSAYIRHAAVETLDGLFQLMKIVQW
ncbi:unnamed protein product [Bathycoccus prasinos]